MKTGGFFFRALYISKHKQKKRGSRRVSPLII